MKILTVLGARPQFIKAAAISRIVGNTPGLFEVIVHTGQHHDANMSDIFFDELGIPRPAFNLGVAGLSHGAMTGRMLEGVEGLLKSEKPDVVLVYGDTNSTLAGALAAAKLHVPVAHVEAGLRSHNAFMPEEVNRVLTDRMSTWLFCPTDVAVANLRAEGFPHPVPGRRAQKVLQVGDVMFDVTLYFRDIARERIPLSRYGVDDGSYVLCTLHRAENTDQPERLAGILAALRQIAARTPVLLPLHPRTRQLLTARGEQSLLNGLTILEPLAYLDMQRLEMGARAILTDSGGVQKEAFFHGVPCITLRDETEWVETVELGWNTLVGADPDRILAAVAGLQTPSERPQVYGDGAAAERIVGAIAAA
jgi:UDP-GlcNAc3NAcA epimerase